MSHDRHADGGPAFSRPIGQLSGEIHDEIDHGAEGMSLRDYFAGQAIAGLLATRMHDGGEDLTHEQHAAQVAYAYADAMLAARTRHREEEPVPSLPTLTGDHNS